MCVHASTLPNTSSPFTLFHSSILFAHSAWTLDCLGARLRSSLDRRCYCYLFRPQLLRYATRKYHSTMQFPPANLLLVALGHSRFNSHQSLAFRLSAHAPTFITHNCARTCHTHAHTCSKITKNSHRRHTCVACC